MLSSIKKVNPYSSFPVDLQANFNIQKEKLNIFTQTREGEKIGKDKEGKYYIFSNSYVQLATRWWYEENRANTINYIDEDLGNYIDGLKLSDGTLSFDGIDFLSQLILSAIQYEDASVDMDADYIVDTVVFKQPDVLGDVITAFFESFPKFPTPGKII